MKRTALILVLLAACGGKKPTPAQPPETTSTEQAATTEPATPAEPAKPAEAPPEPAKPDEGAIAAAALAEQYDAGKKVYTDKGCAKCHGEKGEGTKKSPPVIGEKALPEKAAKTAKARKTVKFTTAADVLGFVKAKMPAGKEAGTLTDDEAAAVTAWILSENKAKIEKKLDASNAASVTIR